MVRSSYPALMKNDIILNEDSTICDLNKVALFLDSSKKDVFCMMRKMMVTVANNKTDIVGF